MRNRRYLMEEFMVGQAVAGGEGLLRMGEILLTVRDSWSRERKSNFHGATKPLCNP